MTIPAVFEAVAKPNLRLKSAHQKCLAYLELVDELNLFNERQVHISELTRRLGNPTRPIAKFLMQGLIREGSYSAGSRSFTYRPNNAFADNLRTELGINETSVLEIAKKCEKVFVPCAREDAKKTGNRYYPWWATMKSEKMHELFLSQFGKMHKYDMCASKQTIQLGIFKAKSSIQLKYWELYVADRSMFRTKIAQDLNIDIKTVKSILQAISNGGYASLSPYNPICKDIGIAKTALLMNHEFYIGIREEFKVLRNVLFEGIKIRDTKRMIHDLYEEHENKIMELVAKKLNSENIDAWFIHDGFMTHTKCDINKIQLEVNFELNMNVTFDEEIITAR